jgi:multidrug efflux pump subunit AcrA (membrane-fusion protein)
MISASICHAQAPGTAPQATPLLVAKVAEATPSLSRECRGTAEAIETVHVIARVSGLLEKVNFKEGNTVDKGELLFNIEDTEYVANLRAAKLRLSPVSRPLKKIAPGSSKFRLKSSMRKQTTTAASNSSKTGVLLPKTTSITPWRLLKAKRPSWKPPMRR